MRRMSQRDRTTEHQQVVTQPGAIAVLVSALASGLLWGPAIQAPWYGFVLATGIALVVGFAALAASRLVLRLGARASATAALLLVLVTDIVAFAWGVFHSH